MTNKMNDIDDILLDETDLPHHCCVCGSVRYLGEVYLSLSDYYEIFAVSPTGGVCKSFKCRWKYALTAADGNETTAKQFLAALVESENEGMR